MTTKTVTSPAGETIEVVPNDEWMELTGITSDAALRNWHGLKPAILSQLWLHGAIHDNEGHATAVLLERIRSAYPNTSFGQASALTTLLTHQSVIPVTQRKVVGKRTYSIRLVALPEIWHARMIGDIERSKRIGAMIDARATNGTAHVEIKPWPRSTFEAALTVDSDRPDNRIALSSGPIEETVPIVEQPERSVESLPEEEPSPVLELAIASQVAMQLLTTVVEIISAGTPEQTDAKYRALQSEFETVAARLADRLGENDRLRRQVRELGDEIRALKYERDSLRKQLKATEHNLTAALHGDSARAVNAEITKRVDAIMRTTPTGANAKGEG